jgi:protein-tyrosine kinase
MPRHQALAIDPEATAFAADGAALRLASDQRPGADRVEPLNAPAAPHTPAVRDPHPALVMLSEPQGDAAERFRTLRSQLGLRLGRLPEPPMALAVVSAAAGDGRSWCAANLALAFAQLGERTLLIDANLRRPRLAQLFGMTGGAAVGGGLAGWLAGANAGRALCAVPGLPSLCLLPAGAAPKNPLELVEGAAFGALMRDLAGRFTRVVVDTPAAEDGADASVIASRCGAALLVTRRDSSRVTALRALLDSFSGRPVHVVGAVMHQGAR